MKNPRLTDEELSRVMTAHELGGLARGNGEWAFPDNEARGYPCCLVQAARVSAMAFHTVGETGDDRLEDAVGWFDTAYEPTWTVDEFLAQLEARGLA